MERRTLILASASPRRRELLRLMGVDYLPCAVDVDEHADGAPQERVTALAEKKARAAQRDYPGYPILGADTLVFCQGEILGKPENAQDARRMLRLLSGRTHTVYTGVCLLSPQSGRQVRCDETRVEFIPLDDETIERYIASGEPMDKAGAYGVQGRGGMFVAALHGSPSNVIGLPMHAVRDMLIQIGWEL